MLNSVADSTPLKDKLYDIALEVNKFSKTETNYDNVGKKFGCSLKKLLSKQKN